MKRRPEFRLVDHNKLAHRQGDVGVAETCDHCIVMDEADYYCDEPAQDAEFARLLAAAPALADVAEAFVAHYPMGTNPFLDETFRLALRTTNQLKVKP